MHSQDELKKWQTELSAKGLEHLFDSQSPQGTDLSSSQLFYKSGSLTLRANDLQRLIASNPMLSSNVKSPRERSPFKVDENGSPIPKLTISTVGVMKRKKAFNLNEKPSSNVSRPESQKNTPKARTTRIKDSSQERTSSHFGETFASKAGKRSFENSSGHLGTTQVSANKLPFQSQRKFDLRIGTSSSRKKLIELGTSQGKSSVSIKGVLSKQKKSESRLKTISRLVDSKGGQASPTSGDSIREGTYRASKFTPLRERNNSNFKTMFDISGVSLSGNEDFFRHSNGLLSSRGGKTSTLGLRVDKIIKELQRTSSKSRSKIKDEYLQLDTVVRTREIFQKERTSSRSKTPIKKRQKEFAATPDKRPSSPPVKMRPTKSYIDISANRCSQMADISPFKHFPQTHATKVDFRKAKRQSKLCARSHPKQYFSFFFEQEEASNPPCKRPYTSTISSSMQGSDPFRPIPCPPCSITFPKPLWPSDTAVRSSLSVTLNIMRLGNLKLRRVPRSKVKTPQQPEYKDRPNGKKTVTWNPTMDPPRPVSRSPTPREDPPPLTSFFHSAERVDMLNSINRMKMKVLGMDKPPPVPRVLPRPPSKL